MAGFCGNQGGQSSQAGQLNQPQPATQLGQQTPLNPVSSGLCNALPPPQEGTPGAPQKNPLAWAPVGFNPPQQGRPGSGPGM